MINLDRHRSITERIIIKYSNARIRLRLAFQMTRGDIINRICLNLFREIGSDHYNMFLHNCIDDLELPAIGLARRLYFRFISIFSPTMALKKLRLI